MKAGALASIPAFALAESYEAIRPMEAEWSINEKIEIFPTQFVAVDLQIGGGFRHGQVIGLSGSDVNYDGSKSNNSALISAYIQDFKNKNPKANVSYLEKPSLEDIYKRKSNFEEITFVKRDWSLISTWDWICDVCIDLSHGDHISQIYFDIYKNRYGRNMKSIISTMLGGFHQVIYVDTNHNSGSGSTKYHATLSNPTSLGEVFELSQKYVNQYTKQIKLSYLDHQSDGITGVTNFLTWSRADEYSEWQEFDPIRNTPYV